jgi:acyl-CoA thioesterase
VGTDDEQARARARRIADRITAGSGLARTLDIELVEVMPGRAVLEMTVTPALTNWHGTCHGGAISALADTAFGYACQSSGEAMVAAGFDITFVAPAPVGHRLVAVAVDRIRYGRSGLVDVTVYDGDPEQGRVVAELRGRSRSLGRSSDPADDPDQG